MKIRHLLWLCTAALGSGCGARTLLDFEDYAPPDDHLQEPAPSTARGGSPVVGSGGASSKGGAFGKGGATSAGSGGSIASGGTGGGGGNLGGWSGTGGSGGSEGGSGGSGGGEGGSGGGEEPAGGAPGCGNGTLEPGEKCDGAAGLPAATVQCFAPPHESACLFDFSNVSQLYCLNACSWDAPDDGCEQEDADIFCKLRTGWSGSVALDYELALPLSEPGFACSSHYPWTHPTVISLGSMPEYGVDIDVRFEIADVMASHGQGEVIVEPNCTTP